MSELALYAFDKPLALSPNTRIRLRRVNPMFGDGTTQGTFSFPFQLPKKPNMQVLGFSHDPQVSNPLTVIREGVRLEYAGTSLKGSLTINDAGSFFECQFLVDNGDAAQQLQNKKLQDLGFATAFQSITTGPGSQNRARNLARAVTQGGWPKWPYVVFPFYNSDYFNKNPKTAGYYVANNWFDAASAPDGLPRPIVPGDKNGALLLIITGQIGTFIDGEQVVSSGGSTGIAAPFVITEPNRLVIIEPVGTSWSPGTITGTISGATADVNTTSTDVPWPSVYWQCPAVYVMAVFEGIAKELGYEFNTELISDAEIISLVMLTGKSICFGRDDQYNSPPLPLYLALLPDGFYLKDMLPQMTVSEFLNEFKEFWGWVAFFDQQNERFTVTPLKTLLNLPPDGDWTTAASEFYNKELRDEFGKATLLTMQTDPADTLAPMKSIAGRRVVSISSAPAGGYRVGDIAKNADGIWVEYVQNTIGAFVTQFYSNDLGEAFAGAGEVVVKASKFGIAASKDAVRINADITTRMPFFGNQGGINGFD
ncbi:MAG: hypothetical protein Q8J69_07815, partial [Sphingobacteriaceae bacterium]|nr:hypothetical protein [Sphingobacteriaceae bacterium]